MCTLNVLIAKDKNKEFLFPPEIVEYMICSYSQDYTRNSDGCGTYNGTEVVRNFGWVPFYITQAILSKSPVLMAHTRLATCAKKSLQSLQPFLFEDYGLICMHNGVFHFMDLNIDTSVYSDSWHYFDKLTRRMFDIDVAGGGLTDIQGTVQAAILEVDKELSGESPHSCFMYEPDYERAFYWKRGRTMFIAEENDFVFLSSTDKKELGLNMKPVVDEKLIMFSYNDKGLLVTKKVDVKYADKRWDRGKYVPKSGTRAGEPYDYELSRALKNYDKTKDFPVYLEQLSDKKYEEDWDEGTSIGESDSIVLRKYGI